uniref:Uncharacterized protein n=1 Tax=Anguilla anguilla TaxID=7936 RepID=A0A0E9XUA1_ANGAN
MKALVNSSLCYIVDLCYTVGEKWPFRGFSTSSKSPALLPTPSLRRNQ